MKKYFLGLVASWPLGQFCRFRTTALVFERIGGARRNRTADLLHAIPLFVVPALSSKYLIFNNINTITSRDFPACPIDTRKFRCYLVARWLLEIK
jgi:hypothetical protein